ncbi:MAG: prepilin-type N-terminal cleavage/methylation domain-containing protein [Planctomycetaceae bacterium]|jgi:prepilin-type N-terminal cleavage/methylation domain-containing protein|nr:prepilin-type N-terminal cleavage/methylation domain-containing protein [Planctomycetaceae bacterium]
MKRLEKVNRHGFTFIEIVIVIAVLVIIAALGMPALQGTLAQYRLRSAADTLRGEWLDVRIKAMEEGQIFSMRCRIGTDTLILDRILDAHFTAGLSSRSTNRRFDETGELDPFERGNFTGEVQDFMLREPTGDVQNPASESTVIRLPETVRVTEIQTVIDERSAFYAGLINPAETTSATIDETGNNLIEAEISAGTNTAGVWSSPIFFYPDGTTSTATVVLQNELGKSITVRLRGLTGIGSIVEE